MSNFAIAAVCLSIILLGWLLRRYQDKQGITNPKKHASAKGAKQSLKNTFTANKSLTLQQVVADVFVDYIIKEKVNDKNCVFICQKMADDPSKVVELAIVKYIAGEKKQIRTMGSITSVTYPRLPSKKELKKDLAQL